MTSSSFDEFWKYPPKNFSYKNFIHCVKNSGCSVQFPIHSQEFSTSNSEDKVSSNPSHGTEIFLPSQEYSEKNSCSVELNSCLSKEEFGKGDSPPGFFNVGHLSDFSRFDNLLLQRWKEASVAGALNYDVDEVVTKILTGKYGIVAQLNPARAVKRRKPQPFTRVDEPFNAKSFNFTKIKSLELLFNIHLSLSSGEEVDGSFIVNAAPICLSHSLLLPSVASSLPQVIDREGLLLAVSAVLLSNLRSFRVGFNSLCAYASVNHHHYHCYYLPQKVYVEAAACRHVHGPCYVFTDHYAPGFVFQADPNGIMDCVGAVMKLLTWLVTAGVPHNVFITRGLPLSEVASGPCAPHHAPHVTEGSASGTGFPGSARAVPGGTASDDGAGASGLCCAAYSAARVCVWARQPVTGAKDVSVFAPALCELAGHVPIYDPDEWDRLNEKDIADEIHSLCEDAFNLVLSNIKNIL